LVNSLYMGADGLEELNLRLQDKLATIQQNEVRYETHLVEDAEIVLVAFGTPARGAKTAVQHLRRQGMPVGLFRPITLWPFPEEELRALAEKTAAMLVVEMNAGQMLHDVQRVVGRGLPVEFLGRMGGQIPLPEEVETAARTLYERVLADNGDWLQNP
ncbi:MAG TPA: transketolase C-terminal domain-containing protein, partial [Chloroflexota bacterium]|nr:transketolase C-terminal domain-containing protein [Chloroflexota bacterium]